jgi:hypothetical protein
MDGSKNMMGRLLMELRENLKTIVDRSPYPNDWNNKAVTIGG